MRRSAIMQRLLERIQHEAGMRRPAGAPADDPAGVGVDDEGDVDKARPGRDVGEVRHPKPVRRWSTELAVDVIERARRRLVADRGAHRLPRITPAKPISRISRATVQRATGTPSRIICRQTLRTP